MLHICQLVHLFFRCALHLVDTIRVEADRSSLFTEGAKSTKDTLFFLNPENEVDEEEDKQKTKKVPVKPLVNGFFVKKKTFGGKVLRNKMRSTAQEEVLMTAAAKIKEHQQQLHEGL